MKPFLFEIMKTIIGDAKCSIIGEIGTHHGTTAYQLVTHFAPLVEHVNYYGYDIFDKVTGDREFHKKERNGKGAGSITRAKERLNKAKQIYRNISYELYQGLTTDTLSVPKKFDFVYIDGGHSYETVKHDYLMVKNSKLIVFDDYKIPGVKKLVEEIKNFGVDVEIISTPSKHIWAVIRN
jgi:hypothetical protein